MIAKKSSRSKFSASDNFLVVLLVFFNLAILGFLLVANVKLFAQTGEARNKYLDLNKEIRDLERKNEELEQLLALTTDEVQIEKFLREKGLYKKEGEEVVVIKREGTDEEPAPVVQQSASLWDKIADFFRNIFGRD